MKRYKTVKVVEVSLEQVTGVNSTRIDDNENYTGTIPEQLQVSEEDQRLDEIRETEILAKYTGNKRKIVKGLLEGESFLSMSKKLKISTSTAYKIKRELMKDFEHLKKQADREKWLRSREAKIRTFLSELVESSKKTKLARFQEIYVNDYDPEAQQKGWGYVPLQNTYEDVWENHQKSIIQAPREHLKTTSAITYIIKKVFERSFPLEINYFHLDKDIAIEKIRKLQTIVERNPLLASNFGLDDAKNWKDGEIRLKDGTTIKAMGWLQGTVGRHPHLIVIDDVIDVNVVYSDVKNDKAIRKFYSEIYPMISKLTPDKKIIVIGTAQREDDLYAKLPADFHRLTLEAHNNQNEPLEPALFSFEELMKIKADLSKEFGEKYWLKEYMNIPFSAAGIIIKPDWIMTYAQLDESFIKKLDIYQGWDLSVGKKVEEGDWTAGATIGIEELDDMIKIWVLEMIRARVKFAERLKMIVANANKWSQRKKIGIEENVFQYDTVQTLQKQTNLPIIGVKSITNKIESFQVELAPHFENKKVVISADMVELRQELLSLPAGEHDDMCDALKIAIKVSAIKTKEPRIRVLG